jgi:hypothetical protein
MEKSGAKLTLQGALKVASEVATEYSDAGPRGVLENWINLGARQSVASGTSRPGVAPPLYGGTYPKVQTVTPQPPWLPRLNLDPRHRVTASLGVEVVRRRQEALMAAAWDQVGDIERANQLIRQAQFAYASSQSLLQRHLAPLPPGDALQVTAPAHSRIMAGNEEGTLQHNIEQSAVPAAVVQPAFRRLVRPLGPLGRRIARVSESSIPRGSMVERLDDGQIQAEPSDDRRGLMTMEGLVGAVEAGGEALGRRGTPVKVQPSRFGLTGENLSAALVTADIGVDDRTILRIDDDGELFGGGVTVDLGSEAALPSTAELQLLSLETLNPSLIDDATGSITLEIGGRREDLTADFKFGIKEHLDDVRLPDPDIIIDIPLHVSELTAQVLQQLEARRAFAALLDHRLNLPGSLPKREPFEPILAAPNFPAAMYEELKALSTDWLLPGAELVPPNNVFALSTNSAFVAAFMMGINHEMGRELLWREFPTDQRGTYFRHFWDRRGTADFGKSDISEPIHKWKRDLGQDLSTGELLVVVLRADFLRRYPRTMIYAIRAKHTGPGKARELDNEQDAKNIATFLFRGSIEPEIVFFGFPFPPEEARGDENDASKPGWFLVFQEQPTEPRFGLDAPDSAAPKWPVNASDLKWNDVPKTKAGYLDLKPDANRKFSDRAGSSWGGNSADMAHLTIQQPMRVAIHMSDLLEES